MKIRLERVLLLILAVIVLFFGAAVSQAQQKSTASLGSLSGTNSPVTSSNGAAKARENAVNVWMELHRDDSSEGVALLKRAVDETNDTAVKQRLLWAVSKALASCSPFDKRKCETAAKTGYAN